MNKAFYKNIWFFFVFILLVGLINIPDIKGADSDSYKNGRVLISRFTSEAVTIDGRVESLWNKSVPSPIEIAMACDLSKKLDNCRLSGNVRSLWDGAVLYLLVEINDGDNFISGSTPTDKDSLEIFFDLFNDKNPKFLEDDWTVQIDSNGDLTGRGNYAERIKDHAVKPVLNNKQEMRGYRIELAIYLGGITIENGTTIGMDFCINDAETATHKCRTRLFWSDGNNKGLDDNRGWGTVKLSGYDGETPMALDTYTLKRNIKKAEELPRGIWKSEQDIEEVLKDAKKALASDNQNRMYKSSAALDHAIKNLRRTGKYPDPRDLPEIKYLPDPFTFFNGTRVRTRADWNKRREEIKDLAQYYEYGYMPDTPEAVTAEATASGLNISVTDRGKTAEIKALLTLPTFEQCDKKGPYPVVVIIDFWPMKANDIYLKAGYAVLSIVYSSAASDDDAHSGAFYTLYPYDVTTGKDAGTLLAWAWGASRGVDALEYLDKNNPDFKGKLDLGKLVVTGFSRCGKAALAAGLFDNRFGVVSPGASGCGGAAVYRYESTGNVYDWGISPGCEVLGDKTRHQGHNANEMLPRFLNYDRIYDRNTHGYGERLPYDHHEIIAAIAPRAVLITTAKNDYANGAEGDSIGLEGAKPVFNFLNAEKNIGFNIRMSDEKSPWGFGGGHFQSDGQIQNLVDFADMVFFKKALSMEQKVLFYSNPYIPTYIRYYGGLKTMMPWIE